MGKLSSSNKQLSVKLRLWPVSYKKVRKLKLITISWIHLRPCPITSYSIEFLTYHPSFWIISFFPSLSKHKFDMNSIWWKSEHWLFFIMKRFIIEWSASRNLDKWLISFCNKTSTFRFFVRLWGFFKLLLFYHYCLFF